MFRRDLLKSALLGTAAIATARAMQSETARAAESATPLQTLSDELDHQLLGDDGLARPISTEPTVSDLAKGLDRTLALRRRRRILRRLVLRLLPRSLRSWARHGRPARDGRGDSAGSYIGSSLTSGHFLRLRSQFEFFGHFPQIFARLAPLSSPNASQQRALKLSAGAKNGETATLRTSAMRRSPPTTGSMARRSRGSRRCSRATAGRIGRWRRCGRRQSTVTPAND